MSDAASAAAPCPVVRARSILQKVRAGGNEWFGIDYNMNLYRGCCHGCIYCDSRSECYRIDDFDRVRRQGERHPPAAAGAGGQAADRGGEPGGHGRLLQPLFCAIL